MSPRALHSTNTRELAHGAGFLHLDDDQARVLGPSRSTTWTIIQAQHKCSGLSASVIRRMLSQPGLPTLVRPQIDEYVDEKSAGMYGHRHEQVRRFVSAVSRQALPAMSRIKSGVVRVNGPMSNG